MMLRVLIAVLVLGSVVRPGVSLCSDSECDLLGKVLLSPRALAAASCTEQELDLVLNRLQSDSSDRASLEQAASEYAVAVESLSVLLDEHQQSSDLSSIDIMNSTIRSVNEAGQELEKRADSFRAYLLTDLPQQRRDIVQTVIENQRLGLPWEYWAVRWTEEERRQILRAIKLQRSGLDRAEHLFLLNSARSRAEVVDVSLNGEAKLLAAKNLLGCGD